MVGLTRNQQVREELDLAGAAAEEVKLLKRQIRNMDDDDIEASITRLLSAKQLSTLSRLTIQDQVPRLGTANALCYGMLARAIGLTKPEADTLYATSKNIGKELSADIQQAKLDLVREGLSSLPPEQVKKVCDLVGELELTQMK
jgi:hypothetical protein